MPPSDHDADEISSRFGPQADPRFDLTAEDINAFEHIGRQAKKADLDAHQTSLAALCIKAVKANRSTVSVECIAGLREAIDELLAKIAMRPSKSLRDLESKLLACELIPDEFSANINLGPMMEAAIFCDARRLFPCASAASVSAWIAKWRAEWIRK
jgi:hypothetical protein